MRQNGEYIPLSQHPGQGELDDEPRLEGSHYKRKGVFGNITPILIRSAFLISLLSFGITLYSLHFRSIPSFSERIYDLDVSQLRHPSLYTGLERVPEIQLSMAAAALHENASDPEAHAAPQVEEAVELPVGAGRASTVARVSSRYPDRHFTQDGWILLTKEDTTLMTFRTPNTSTCKFHLSFPTRDVLTATHRLLTLENPASVASPFSPGIEIHVLDLPEAMSFDSGKATWNSRPSRGMFVPAVDVAFGEEFISPGITCADPYIMLELACVGAVAEEGCRVEWKEEAGEPLIGIEILAA
ncbi:hypothetical protein EVG20_g7177 [Dentipellis fragilis]|uniref:Uncharacterized protein n=1 Tax=Dentipellis fragilis TaxID=205917 RepID=A0A4Y9YEZ4_9AGAM|nr:hypothetical protein EVG20_g7177 [Dentipellis fragilis]